MPLQQTDFHSKWQAHLRLKSRTTLNLACPYCQSRRSFNAEDPLVEHVKSDHPERVPQTNDELSEFWRTLRDEATVKRSAAMIHSKEFDFPV